jgi:hypothetical protein
MASSLNKEIHSSLVNRTIKLAQNAPTRLKVFFVWRSGGEFSWLSLSLALSQRKREGEAMISP